MSQAEQFNNYICFAAGFPKQTIKVIFKHSKPPPANSERSQPNTQFAARNNPCVSNTPLKAAIARNEAIKETQKLRSIEKSVHTEREAKVLSRGQLSSRNTKVQNQSHQPRNGTQPFVADSIRDKEVALIKNVPVEGSKRPHQHKKMLSQYTTNSSKKNFASGSLVPANILQTPQSEGSRKIDEYTQRSKNMQKQLTQQKPIVGWVKNVKVHLNLEDRRLSPDKKCKGQLSQRGPEKSQRSISNVKAPPRKLKTQGANRPLGLPERIGQTRKLEQLRQIVVSQGSQTRRSASESKDIFKTPIKTEIHQQDPFSVRINKSRRKLELGNNCIRDMTSPRPPEIPLTSRKEVRRVEKYGAVTERRLNQGDTNNNNELEVRTVDRPQGGTSLGLPDDSNYNRMVSFIEDLKQSIEIPYRKVLPVKLPYPAKPAIAIQNFAFNNTMGKSKSMKTLKRVVMDRTRTIANKRCGTPNDLHPTALVTRPSAFSTTSSPHRDRTVSVHRERPKLSSVVLHRPTKYSTDNFLMLNHLSSAYGNPKDCFPDDVNLNNTRIDNNDSAAIRTIDHQRHDISTGDMFMEQLNLKLQQVMNMRSASEKYLTVRTPSHHVESLIKPTKPMTTKKADHLKFRLARKLYTKGKELITQLGTEAGRKPTKESNSTIKEEEEANEFYSSVSPTNKKSEAEIGDKSPSMIATYPVPDMSPPAARKDQSASVSVSRLDVSELKDYMHIQKGETLMLFPVLKIQLPFNQPRIAVHDVFLLEPVKIPWGIPVPLY